MGCSRIVEKPSANRGRGLNDNRYVIKSKWLLWTDYTGLRIGYNAGLEVGDKLDIMDHVGSAF